MDRCVDKVLSSQKAMEKIREIAKYGSVVPTPHCRKDSMPKRGFTIQDIIAILLNGEITIPPEFDSEFGNYKYRVEGYPVDEDEKAVAITVIIDHRSALIVTVF